MKMFYLNSDDDNLEFIRYFGSNRRDRVFSALNKHPIKLFRNRAKKRVYIVTRGRQVLMKNGHWEYPEEADLCSYTFWTIPAAKQALVWASLREERS